MSSFHCPSTLGPSCPQGDDYANPEAAASGSLREPNPLYHITERSANRKTGDMLVTTTDARSCPESCPLGPSGNAACYALGGPLAKLVTASCAWTGLARIAQADANAANARGRMDHDACMPAPERGIRKPPSDEGGEPAL